MAKAVIHRTPGLIDRTAFTTFGVNSKPASKNPIGIFGTGLKYAIAVLARHNIKVTLFIGHEEYVFYTKSSTFRDKSFDFVYMKRRKGLFARWQYEQLPFTTELGKKWELWQAFRELYANTLDEGGSTFLATSYPGSWVPAEGETYFIIEDPRYVDEYYERGKNFLVGGATERVGADWLQVLDRPSQHIYYRGMRIMDLKAEAQFTYNFLKEVELTEDRTAKYPWLLESQIIEYMVEHGDAKLMRKAVARPRAGSYESSLNYSSHYYGSSSAATPQFLKAAKASSNVTAVEIWNKLQPTVPSTVTVGVTFPQSSMNAEEFDKLVTLLRDEFGDGIDVFPQGFDIIGHELEAADVIPF